MSIDAANTYSARWFAAFGDMVDPTQTQREADGIRRFAPPQSYRRVLDVCCGSGRHAAVLAKLGYSVTGIDRDFSAIDAARRAAPAATFIAGDVRRLRELVDGSFDLIIILWQSFGYFDREGNRQLLKDVHELTRPSGRLLLDVYDARFFANHLEPRSLHTASGVRFVERKWLQDGRLRVELTYEDGEMDVFDWQIFTPDDLGRFAASTGWIEVTRSVRFDAECVPDGTQPRMQMLFQRE